MIRTELVAACTAAWCVLAPPAASAAEGCGQIARSNVVKCVLAASLALRHEQLGSDVMRGRVEAASPLLPANPQLSLSAAHRRTDAQGDGNWNANLSQEIEVAGQRSARKDAAGASLRAQQETSRATERDVAAEGLQAYFEVLAARDALQAATKLEGAFASGNRAASAGATQGLVSGIDAELAELTLVRLTQTRIVAQRRERQALAALAALLGLDPQSSQPQVEGELTPLPRADVADVDKLVEQRPELARARETGRALRSEASTWRRSRIPNVTLSLFAQRDGFNERVLGGGISLPIPLPHPLGRTYAGEIAASEAQAEQADAAVLATRRHARLELVTASEAYTAAEAQTALFTERRVSEAEQSLQSLAQEIHAGRIAITSAVIAQQTLIEFLQARIEAQLELCLSSVALARAAGVDLKGGRP